MPRHRETTFIGSHNIRSVEFEVQYMPNNEFVVSGRCEFYGAPPAPRPDYAQSIRDLIDNNPALQRYRNREIFLGDIEVIAHGAGDRYAITAVHFRLGNGFVHGERRSWMAQFAEDLRTGRARLAGEPERINVGFPAEGSVEIRAEPAQPTIDQVTDDILERWAGVREFTMEGRFDPLPRPVDANEPTIVVGADLRDVEPENASYENIIAEAEELQPQPRRRRRRSQLMIPETPIDAELRRVPISEINMALIAESVQPTARLTRSIEALGIIQPVALIEGNPNARQTTRRLYTIAAGQRRIMAAYELGHADVPALVFPNGTPRNVAASMALSENFIRRANPVTETLEAARLLREGYSPEEICRELRLPNRTFRGRLRLALLPDSVLSEMAAGNITLRMARMIAQLPAAARAQVIEEIQSGTEITIELLRSYQPRPVTQEELIPIADGVTARVQALTPERRHALETALENTVSLDGLDVEIAGRIRNLIEQVRGRGNRFSARLAVSAEEAAQQRGIHPSEVRADTIRPEGPITQEMLQQATERIQQRINADVAEAFRTGSVNMAPVNTGRVHRTFRTVPAGTPVAEAREEQRARRTPEQRQTAANVTEAIATMPRRWITVQTLIESTLTAMPDAALYTQAAQREIAGIALDLNAIHDRVQGFVEAESTVNA